MQPFLQNCKFLLTNFYLFQYYILYPCTKEIIKNLFKNSSNINIATLYKFLKRLNKLENFKNFMKIDQAKFPQFVLYVKPLLQNPVGKTTEESITLFIYFSSIGYFVVQYATLSFDK